MNAPSECSPSCSTSRLDEWTLLCSHHGVVTEHTPRPQMPAELRKAFRESLRVPAELGPVRPAQAPAGHRETDPVMLKAIAAAVSGLGATMVGTRAKTSRATLLGAFDRTGPRLPAAKGAPCWVCGSPRSVRARYALGVMCTTDSGCMTRMRKAKGATDTEALP